ncbi:MAG: MBL fold metallo-hydrolase, partial [Nanoarchaeota archaeon]|nr:MBL fold metallo-hydrolase [Nanoarchaeota archaeon]
MEIVSLDCKNVLQNVTYLIIGKNNRVICIDPNSASLLIDELEKRKLSLALVINTHEHSDHTDGNELLAKKYAC